MKTVIIAVLLLSSVAMADKESSKGRVDDCFTNLNDMLQELNEFPGTTGDFQVKKARCWKLEKAYEKQYGKYTLPDGLN